MVGGTLGTLRRRGDDADFDVLFLDDALQIIGARHLQPVDLFADLEGIAVERADDVESTGLEFSVVEQGATEVALTKLDVLSYMKEIPICEQYEVDGEKTDDFPFTAVIDKAKPVMTAMPGWGCDISGVRKYEDLPVEARNYVEYIEKQIGCHISYVSVGAKRDEIIYR